MRDRKPNSAGAWAYAAAAICLAAPPARIAAQRPAYPPLSAVLRLEKPSLTIGSVNGSGPDLFGTVVGVTMDSAGNVYVLDRTDDSIREFAKNGSYVGSAGRAGNRPGEFRDPLGLWHDGRNSLFVVDRYHGIVLFTTGDGSPTYRSQLKWDFRPTSVCGIGNDLIVAGVHDDHILSVVSRDGAIKRSFGERFRRDSVRGIQQTYDTDEFKVACDSKAGRIFVAEGTQNLVRAYDLNGRVLWEAQLPEYDGNVVRRNTNPPGIAVFYGKFSTKTVTLVDPNLLIVQASHRSGKRDPARGGTFTITDQDIVTYALAASTGSILTRQSAGPFLSLSRGDETVGYDQQLFPRAYLLRAHTVASGR